MKIRKLIQNIVDQIKEAQIKLGYVKETVRLYYPLSSLNALLETDFDKAEELCKEVNAVLAEEKEMPGEISLKFHGDRIEVSVSPEGAQYVHEKVKASGFLVDMIGLFAKHHNCTLDEICQVFAAYSKEYVCQKMPEGTDFDYVLYFSDQSVDEYYYCVKMEMGHTIYHRFTREDYELLL